MEAPFDAAAHPTVAKPIAAPTHEPIPVIADAEFREVYGEPLGQTLDLGTWRPGEDLAVLYRQLEAQIRDAVAHERPIRETIRNRVLPRIAGRRGAPPGAGVYQASIEDVERVHHALLFNGGVEACDGTSVTHDTLAVTITQIGVGLVSYRGDSGSWVHRLFRRDLRQVTSDPVEEAIAMIEQRQRRRGPDPTDRGSQLSELGRRGILAYAERAVLLERSSAPWRMGHGNPVPYELLTGWGSMELMSAALAVLRRLIGEHQKFVFVPSAPGDHGLLTIGHALLPLEFAIVDTATARLHWIVERGHYGKLDKRQALEFVETFGPQIVIGLYRASPVAPPRLFYAHVDHAPQAALIAIADSVLQEHRGFPTLIDLADTVCRTTFGVGDFLDSVRLAYADAGQPYRYLSERETRR